MCIRDRLAAEAAVDLVDGNSRGSGRVRAGGKDRQHDAEGCPGHGADRTAEALSLSA